MEDFLQKFVVTQLVNKHPPFMETKGYLVQYSTPFETVMCQMNVVYTFPPSLSKIYFNIIILPAPKSSKCSLSLRFIKIRFHIR